MSRGVVLENVTKRYGNVVALDRVSMEIPEGAVYCIGGPNGSGKTTLLNIIAGVITPTAGRVINPFKKIGYCRQNPMLYEDMSVRENIEFFGCMYGVDKKWVENVLHMMGMEGWADFLIRELSQGMKKRCELVMALLPKPSLLVLDEPTTGLDADSVNAIVELVAHIKHDKTIVLATHRLDDFDGIGTHLAIIKNGKKVFEKETHRISYEYRKNYIDIYGNRLSATE
ncbi:MAG: ABC transporter ATP-binding protein [Candidatus Micrarchaeia archaeon]